MNGVVDAFLAIPWLLFLLLIVAIFEAGTGPIVPTLAFFYGLPILRVARELIRDDMLRMTAVAPAKHLRGIEKHLRLPT